MNPAELVEQRRQAQALADRIRREILPKNPNPAIESVEAATVPIYPTESGRPIPAVMIQTKEKRLYLPYDMAAAESDRLADIIRRI